MKRAFIKATVGALAAVSLVACSSNSTTTQESTGESTTTATGESITIVASTAIWGDLAEALLPNESNIKVNTILESNQDDPHSYEATAQDLAALKQADLVVANGGGYDNWLTDFVPAEVPLVTALPLGEGHSHDEEDHDHDHDHADHANETNPHVWLDLAVVSTFVDTLAKAITEAEQSINRTPTTELRLSDVKADLAELEARYQDLPAKNVLLTETVGEALVEHSALNDVTPEGFASSVARESEPSAADLAAAQAAITNGQVDILLTNEQSHTSSAGILIDAAHAENIAVVNINETPNPGETYFTYVATILDSIENAK